MIVLPAGAFTDKVGAYCMEKIPGLKLDPGMYSAFMVVDDKNDFVGGVVLTNFRGTDIEISCAAETPMAWRHDVCKAIFKYVFEQLNCVRCTSITVKGNRRARGFLEGLGFQLEGNVRLGYDGTKDALIYGLLRSECRYLLDEREPDHGEEIRPASSPATGPGSDSASAIESEHRRGDCPSEHEPDQPVHATG